jgi:hypothetical protein
MRGILLSLALAVPGCGEKKPPKAAPPQIDLDGLYLEPTPAVVGTLSITRPDRTWSGPARVELKSTKVPVQLTAEDLDMAEIYDFEVTAEAPATFAQVIGTVAPDVGTFARDEDRLLLSVDRALPTEAPLHLDVVVDPSPEVVPRGDDWMRPGTTLYYGVAFDDTPITQVVPMALTVKVGAGSDGSRMLSWKADIDPQKQLERGYDRVKTGRRQVPAEQVEAGVRHSDAFLRGDDIPEATSIFVSRKALADLNALGGAAFHDEEVGPQGVLVRQAALDVTVQVDDALWTIPTLVAFSHGGQGVYVIANDAQHPLLVSAERPGYRMKLFAIGRPASAARPSAPAGDATPAE